MGIIKQLKELYLCNIKKDIFNFKQEYIKMQNILLNEIQNFIYIINSKEEENIKKAELNKLYKIKENYENNSENINILEEEKNTKSKLIIILF